MSPSAPARTPPAIVLDTNVVLDWLFFRDPSCIALGATIESGALHWITTDSMRDELQRVLDGSSLPARAARPPDLWPQWHRLCRTVAMPTAQVSPGRLRCTDPDDQIFIDVAITHRASWLLSRDRAVLKLARRLREAGVEVVEPRGWRGPGVGG